MARAHFIPSRDSRHRTAVLALYRALAKAASRVTLPARGGNISKEEKPIHRLLRHRFERNAGDTSPRLVFAALTSGYKFLSFLDKAQNGKSDEHQQLLHTLSVSGLPQRSPVAALKPDRDAEKKEPLLIKLSKPGETPRYTSNIYPRPLNSLKKPRRVPKVAATSEAQPFLRTSSTQPPEMSRMIGRKNLLQQQRSLKHAEIRDEMIPDAASEDRWEQLISRQLRKEGLSSEDSPSGMREAYTWSLHLHRLWLQWKMDLTWQDWIARGEALQRIVDAEQQHADEEAGKVQEPEPIMGKHGSAAAVGVRSKPWVNISPPGLDKKLAKVEGHDIFASEVWADVVRSKDGLLQSWAKDQ